MKLGISFFPASDWPAVVAATKVADESGLDAVGFLDHYHSEQPDWGYLSGWSLYGALAMVTRRVHLVPSVLCGPNYLLGVLAKESSMLAIVSGGRFELGIGAGDFPVEHRAWHQPSIGPAERSGRLMETVVALQKLWTGEAVTYEGKFVQLTKAVCAPAPERAPRVVVGAGASARVLRHAVAFADEVNVYATPELVKDAMAAVQASGRNVSVSVYQHYGFGEWPPKLLSDLGRWRDLGVSRCFVTLGFGGDLAARAASLAEAQEQLN